MSCLAGFALITLAALSSTALAGCAATPPDPISNGHLSAAIAGGINTGGAVLNTGKFLVIGDGCLGLQEVFTFEVADDVFPTTYVAALPEGSAITADDTIVLADGMDIELGTLFNYDIGGWGWDPATEQEPSTEITLPDGCPADYPIVAVLPIGD